MLGIAFQLPHLTDDRHCANQDCALVGDLGGVKELHSIVVESWTLSIKVESELLLCMSMFDSLL